jgi:hypothetical protein
MATIPVTPDALGQGAPQAVPVNNVYQLGTVRAAGLGAVQAEEQRRQDADARQATPLVTGMASHIANVWAIARDAKRNSGIENRMLQNMRARRGEYDPEKLAAIREMGGAEIYTGITSVKCRAAAGWVRDTMLGTGLERPWAIRPTPVPDLPVAVNDLIVQQAMKPLGEALAMGQQVDMQQSIQLVSALRDQAMAALKEEATIRADRMADKMEDQLVEGGFTEALDQFIDDVTTFPTAILKGPVVRKKACWSGVPGGSLSSTTQIVLEWERVSPFDFYPCPTMEDVQRGDLIQKHRLSRYGPAAAEGRRGLRQRRHRPRADQTSIRA